MSSPNTHTIQTPTIAQWQTVSRIRGVVEAAATEEAGAADAVEVATETIEGARVNNTVATATVRWSGPGRRTF